jgi:predicted Zn-dependent peptidase
MMVEPAGVELSTLSNGLRVVTHHMPHVATVSLGLWIDAGTRHEALEDHGIAHFLEHMAFKDTGSRTARQMAEAIENVGGEINAATGMETTGYYARVLAADTGLAVRMIAEMLLDPKFSDADMERERGVILQEIAADADQPEDKVYDLMQAAAYPDQALGRSILGTAESVGAISAAALRRYLARTYRAPHIVLSAAGAIDHDTLVRDAESCLAGFDGAERASHDAASYVGGPSWHADEFEQSHVLLAFPAPSYRDPRTYAVHVLAGLLGGGTSSRLFQEVREERGLCYAIEAFAAGFSDGGLFGVHAATRPEAVAQLIDVIVAEIEAVTSGEVSQAEIQRSKAQLRVGLLGSLESTGARSEQLARQTLTFGAPQKLGDLMAQIDAVTHHDVKAVANSIFGGSRPILAEVGPDARASGFANLQRLSNQQRR